MKKIDLSWVLLLLIILCLVTYYKEEIAAKVVDIEINENYNNKEIVSYSNNNKYDVGLTGNEYDFDKEYYIYYNYLSTEEKSIYRQVYANALAYNKTFNTVTKISIKDLNDTMEALFNDHPELFYLDTNYKYKYNSKGLCIEITINFNDTINDINNNKRIFNEEIGKIVNEANKLNNNYEKEKYVYMAVINRVEYDKQAKYGQNAYGALIERKAVCAGYSRLFQLLMQKLEIPTYYVLGYAKEDHAWNMVKLNNEYYNIDLTWDDTGGLFKHFNLTDREINTTHKRTGISKNLPSCNYTTYRFE